MESSILSTVAQTTYNSKKFMFLFYDTYKEKYVCVNRPFVLTLSDNKITGQFITTNWFKWAFSTECANKFMIVCVNEHSTSDNVESIVNAEDYYKLHFYKIFTLQQHAAETLYDDVYEKTRHAKNASTHFSFYNHENATIEPFETFQMNVRLYFDTSDYIPLDNDFVAGHREDTVLLSLPSFELDRSKF